MNTCRTV